MQFVGFPPVGNRKDSHLALGVLGNLVSISSNFYICTYIPWEIKIASIKLPLSVKSNLFKLIHYTNSKIAKYERLTRNNELY